MDASPRAISPLRQRMIDDMRMCKLSPKMQLQYIRAVRRLTGFLGRSPDTVTVEDLRRYQLHLVDHGTSPVSINAAITGLKFFIEITLDRRDLMSKMRPVRVPHKLPVVLSREEAARLIAAVGNLKHQTALSVAYGAGLRASEVVALKVTDIDSQRMTLRIMDRDTRVRDAAAAYLELRAKHDEPGTKLEDAKSSLVGLTSHAKEQGGGLSVTRLWKQGSVDYKRVPALAGIDLQPYRSPAREEVRVTATR
jgi:integrase